MDVGSILNENPGNYSIGRAEVKKIRVKGGSVYNDGKGVSNEVRVKWTGGKESFKFSSIGVGGAKDVLRETFGGLVK